MKRVVISTLILFVIVAAIATPVAAQKATVDIPDFQLYQIQIPIGKKIQITVKITNTGKIDINGFVLSVKFNKPDGSWTTPEDFKYTDVIKPGQYVYKTITPNQVMDVVGTWWVYVYLYTADKSMQLSWDSAPFEVVKPQAALDITKIIPAATVAAISMLILAYAIMRR